MWGWKTGQQLSSEQQNAKWAQWHSQWVRNAQRIIILTDYGMSCGQVQIFTLGYRNVLTAYIYCITYSWRNVTITVLITAKDVFLEQGCFCCSQGDVEHRNVNDISWACWCSLLLQRKAAFSESVFHMRQLYTTVMQHTWGMCITLCNNKPGFNRKQQLPWEHVKLKGPLKFSWCAKKKVDIRKWFNNVFFIDFFFFYVLIFW